MLWPEWGTHLRMSNSARASVRILAAAFARVASLRWPSSLKRAQGKPGADGARSTVCESSDMMHTDLTGTAETSRLSPRNGRSPNGSAPARPDGRLRASDDASHRRKNHEAPLLPVAILQDGATRLLQDEAVAWRHPPHSNCRKSPSPPGQRIRRRRHTHLSDAPPPCARRCARPAPGPSRWDGRDRRTALRCRSRGRWCRRR